MGKKKILVLGGAGYIGSMVNKLLNQRGYETIVLDNLSTGHQTAVIGGKLIIGDVGDLELVRKTLRSHAIDGVIHFAASISVGESVTSPALYYDNNVCKTVGLLEELIAHEIHAFVFSSSAAVYGIPPTDQVTEESPKLPINPYGRSKWMVEQILRDFEAPYRLRSCSLRYFNAAGGDPDGEIRDHREVPQNLIPIALRALQSPRREVSIFGTDYDTPDGTAIRDYIHIYDLAEAHILALDYLLSGGPSCAYNLGVGRGYSVREVLHTIEEVTGRKLNIVESGRRAGDPPVLIADSSRAMRDFNWQATHSDLHTIIADAWRAIQPAAVL